MASSEQTEQLNHMASLYRLTVYEHLWFFARLKNQPEDGLKSSEQTEHLPNGLSVQVDCVRASLVLCEAEEPT